MVAAIILVILSPMAALGADPSDLALGKAEYKRCAACHLKNGAGVPGSFPPLQDRLGPWIEPEAGRTYLILVVGIGLSGPIEVDGKTYRGFMPGQRQSLTPEKIAAVLNYVLKSFNAKTLKEGWQPFTGPEVTSALQEYAEVDPFYVRDLRREIEG